MKALIIIGMLMLTLGCQTAIEQPEIIIEDSGEQPLEEPPEADSEDTSDDETDDEHVDEIEDKNAGEDNESSEPETDEEAQDEQEPDVNKTQEPVNSTENGTDTTDEPGAPEDTSTSEDEVPDDVIDKAIVAKTEFNDLIDYCHYSLQLEKGDTETIENLGDEIEIKLVDFMKDDPEFSQDITNLDGTRTWTIESWATLSIQKNIVQMPLRLAYEFETDSRRNFLTTAYLIRDETVYVCLATDEEFNAEYCDVKEGQDRTSCFNSLGSLNGEEYCDQINDEDDKIDCVTGATI